MTVAQRDFPIQLFDVVPSTNDTILEAGAGEAPEGTTHIAREQTKGRGRGERVWWSPAGAGLWMSTLLRPEGRRSAWGGISLLAGVAARRALVKLGVGDVRVFWPNDLRAGGRKLGGILGEVRSRGSRSWIALGMGINIDLGTTEVEAVMPASLRGRITSLVEAGPAATTDPVTIARAILNELWPLYTRFLAGGTVAHLVAQEVTLPDREVEILSPGAAVHKGTVRGLAANGELLVRGRDGNVETVVAGEIRYDSGG